MRDLILATGRAVCGLALFGGLLLLGVSSTVAEWTRVPLMVLGAGTRGVTKELARQKRQPPR
ncbi:hypothetical protein [Kitasatospora sp. SolWspMP-SS2h]|uniref:hypothetical protein n=1 Tax=Kitasatospora sp. SolWspMP-SS2h TaxID=1305729 RepID=UPI000DB98EE2|nr:hypothetical protein [Kitasatospora sp. SolWspMP-SS2h]